MFVFSLNKHFDIFCQSQSSSSPAGLSLALFPIHLAIQPDFSFLLMGMTTILASNIGGKIMKKKNKHNTRAGVAQLVLEDVCVREVCLSGQLHFFIVSISLHFGALLIFRSSSFLIDMT